MNGIGSRSLCNCSLVTLQTLYNISQVIYNLNRLLQMQPCGKVGFIQQIQYDLSNDKQKNILKFYILVSHFKMHLVIRKGKIKFSPEQI